MNENRRRPANPYRLRPSEKEGKIQKRSADGPIAVKGLSGNPCSKDSRGDPGDCLEEDRDRAGRTQASLLRSGKRRQKVGGKRSPEKQGVGGEDLGVRKPVPKKGYRSRLDPDSLDSEAGEGARIGDKKKKSVRERGVNVRFTDAGVRRGSPDKRAG